MIRDLSLTLRALFARNETPADSSGVDISFDHPSASFAPSRSTLNLFLYDIREDMELRRSDPSIVREGDRARLRPPPLRVVCAYAITAWPVGGEEPALQEHHMLSQALVLLRRFPVLPVEVLQGELAQQGDPPSMLVAQAPSGDDRGEFWTAVGNRLRPSITLRVTVAMPVAELAPLTAPLVKVHQLRVGERNNPPSTTLKSPPAGPPASRPGTSPDPSPDNTPPANPRPDQAPTRRGAATARRSGRTA